MILGHEMSHQILGHGEQTTQLTALLFALQLVVLSVLDTTGLVSMLTVLGMAPALKYSYELPHSRRQEFEADAMGLRLVARAGYKPHDAAEFFERLDAFSPGSHHSWNSTHPSHEARIHRLHEMETEVMKYYDETVAVAAATGHRAPGRAPWLSVPNSAQEQPGSKPSARGVAAFLAAIAVAVVVIPWQ